jgi:hypothetical protein
LNNSSPNIKVPAIASAANESPSSGRLKQLLLEDELNARKRQDIEDAIKNAIRDKMVKKMTLMDPV